MKGKGKKRKGNAAEESVPKKRGRKKPRANRPKDAVKSKAGKASAAARKRAREEDKPIARRCSATSTTSGEQCKNSAIRGGSVCSRHGGNAPQVRAKANQRLVEMVLPAMRELRRIIDDPDTDDTNKLRAVNMILNRTGYNERTEIDLGLREPTPWDRLGVDGFHIVRGAEAVAVEPADDSPALPGGGGEPDEFDAYNLSARRNANRSDEEAETYLSGLDDADIVVGKVLRDEPTSDDGLLGYPKSTERRYRESGTTEHDPSGTGRAEKPWARYEAEVKRRLDEGR